MHEYLLTVKDIYKSFAGVQALRGVNLSIGPGEVRCLVGENGCGKSTLIKIISGAYTPDDGDIVINGNQYKQLNPIEAIREGIQVIYQDFSLFPNLTVAENVALNFLLEKKRRFVNWKEVRQVASKAIERIGVDIDLDACVEELTVADKQLVAISRALIHNAKIIIMDEPTTALTHKEVKSLFSVVRGLKDEGISVLFVSHKLAEVLEIADKVTIMRNGRQVADGDASLFDQSKISYLMTGRTINYSNSTDQASLEGAPSLMKVEGLTLKGSFEDVNFTLYQGEILGVTGLLGSGRTKLAMSLFGLSPADSGHIFIEDQLVRIKSVEDAIKYSIGYVPEDRLTQGLFLPQSIGKNITASTLPKYVDKYGLLDSGKVGKSVDSWLSQLAVKTPSPDLPVKSLSGGNQQRVVLAKWLATFPKILILNGPTVGVDVGSKSEIHEILKALAAKGIGIIVISDDIPEVLQICNRILLMQKGQIVEEIVSASTSENELALKLTRA